MIEKVATFKERLNEALIVRDMRPVDLAKRAKISESTISQYRSGYAEPKEERLATIANVLDVNPSWLMGLNVPMMTYAIMRRSVMTRITETEERILYQYQHADETTKQIVCKILGVEVENGNGKETQ